MVDEVWLHIGIPKSGTSSLQTHFSKNRAALSEQGLAYLTPPKRSSANELAIALNRGRPSLPDLAADFNHEIEERPEKTALISSEMLYGQTPETMLGLMPALADRPLTVLVYLSRQDRYIQSRYIQRLKNARFFGSMEEFLEKFQGSGSDFAHFLAPWQDAGDTIRLIPRIFERQRLVGGDVVADAMAQLGLPAPEPAAEPEVVNVSPGLHRVQLLQAAHKAGVKDARKLQRTLAQRFPQDPAERAPIFTRAEARAFLDRYATGNEALRARYFPDQDQLFDTTDLDAEDADTGIPPFTPEQLREITQLLKVVQTL